MGRQAVWLLGLDGCESGSFSESGSVCIGMHAAGALAGQTRCRCSGLVDPVIGFQSGRDAG